MFSLIRNHRIALYQQVMDGAVGAVLVVCENAKGWHTANARQTHARFDELLEAIAAEARAREKIHETLGLLESTIADLQTKEYREGQFLHAHICHSRFVKVERRQAFENLCLASHVGSSANGREVTTNRFPGRPPA